jgi:hypothetical protein
MPKALILVYAMLFATSCFGAEREVAPARAESESEVKPNDMSLVDNAAVSLTTVPVAEEEQVCRRERVTGTHISKKVCRTKAQIRTERMEAENYMRRMRTTPSAVPGEGD